MAGRVWTNRIMAKKKVPYRLYEENWVYFRKEEDDGFEPRESNLDATKPVFLLSYRYFQDL